MSERDAPVQREAELVICITTAPDAQVADRLVSQLVDERLIACGNLVPGLTSIYRWQGAVERAGEVMVLMKTPSSLVERLFSRIGELHPYEVPELVALPAAAVSSAYCRWVQQETLEVSA